MRARLNRLAPVFASLAAALLLAACGTTVKLAEPSAGPAKAASKPAGSSNATALPPANSGRGGYYQDDGPPEKVPENLMATPDAQPRVEPYSVPGNRPYVVFGKTYTPLIDNQPFVQSGPGTWYGKKFHGQKTSSGEKYDMFKMTAAHPTLPIPSYARVTNLSNGAQVIVRINDRGPFHSTRIIDLSYTAALKLGYLANGSSMLEVQRLLPEDIASMEKHEPTFLNADSPVKMVAVEAAPIAPLLLVTKPGAAQTASLRPQVLKVNPDVIGDLIDSSGSGTPEAGKAAGSGIYLQFGAYSKVENAEAVLARLLPKWRDDLPPVDIVEYGSMYRIYSGPFVSRDAALAAQRQMPAGVIKGIMVQR
jgi:rare lipoprotein A